MATAAHTTASSLTASAFRGVGVDRRVMTSPTRCRSTTPMRVVALFDKVRAATVSSKAPAMTSADVTPGQGAGSPKWPEIHDRCVAMGVKTVDASQLPSLVADPRRAILVDVRQTIEFDEWRVPPAVNVPYAIPDPNVVRRAVGYAISIKGGLKVRNPEFVEALRAECESRLSTRRPEDGVVVLIDTKGGDLTTEPVRQGSGQLDATDSQSLRAAFELRQAGFKDVRYVKGGLPGAIEDAGMPYESEKWGDFLAWLDTTGQGDRRRLLMYSRLLPDPTNLPGVVGQLAVFTLIGAAYYDAGGIGTWAANNVPGACSLLPVCL